MKAKLQLDTKTIQEFLLQNVEKIGFAAVALIFLLMVYSAMGKVERYGGTPEQLIQAVGQGENAIDQTPPGTDLKVQDYAARAKRSRSPIKENEYETPFVWDNALFPKKPLRDAPPLLAAQLLRGKGEVGAFQMMAETTPENTAAPPGGAPIPGGPAMSPVMPGAVNEVRGQRWIALTALVPIEKQELAYHETFANSKYPDPQNDVPIYLGYWIERVEVPGPSGAAEIDWIKAKKIQSSKAMAEAMSKWAQTAAAEIVEQKYLHERLVFPLGPLVGSQWDESVAHAPEIPINATGAIGMGMGAGMLGGAMPGRPGAGMGLPDELGGGGMRRPGIGGGRMYPGGGARPGAPNAGDDPFSTEEKGLPGTDPAEAEKYAEQNKPASHLLLRFLDFDVEPGKHYVYRVQIALQNPNYKLKPTYLTDAKLAEKYCLETKWSDPSPVISVPRDTRVLAVSVTPGRANRDTAGRVMVAKWVQRRGFTAHDEFPVERGQEVSFTEQKFRRVEGGTQMYGPMGGMPPNPMDPQGGLMGEVPGVGGAVRPGDRTRPADRTRPVDRTPGDLGDPRRNTRRPGLGGAEMPLPGAPFGPGGEMGPMVAPALPGKEWIVNYYSKAIALDFRGGERLSDRRGSGLTSVSEILLLDADGNLDVRNELDDRSDREKLTAASEAPPAPGGTMPGPVPNMTRPKGALDKLFQPDPGGRYPGRR